MYYVILCIAHSDFAATLRRESMHNADMKEYARKIKEPSRFVEEMIADGLKLEDEITIETAEGPKKMLAGDLLKRMKAMERSAEKMKNIDGNLMSEDSGTVPFDELDKEVRAVVRSERKTK